MKGPWACSVVAIAGVLAALGRPLGYEVINLGRGEPVWMDEFVRLIEELTGKQAILDTPPAPPSEPPITFASIDQAHRLLDYSPTVPVAEGLERTWQWYRAELMSSEDASTPA